MDDDTPITPPILNTWQCTALTKIKRLHGHHTIPDGDRFYVSAIFDIGRGAVLVAGYVGQNPDSPRWYEHHYAFKIGPRGCITMVDGPRSVEDFQGKTWCGIHIDIRHLRKSK